MLAAFAACDPTIKKFEVVPEQLDCPGAVKIREMRTARVCKRISP